MARPYILVLCFGLLVQTLTSSAQAQFIPSDVEAADVTKAKFEAMLHSSGTMEAAIRQLAQEKAIPEGILAEVARRLGVQSPELSPVEILAALDRQSKDLADFRQRLLETEGGDSREIATLRRRAARAFDKLQFDEAERLLSKVVERRRDEIAGRIEAQNLANVEAQAQLVKDLIAQARAADSQQQSDRAIALHLEALKEAPARRPAIAAYVKGRLFSLYYDKALNTRDLSSARAAIDLAQTFRTETGRNGIFILNQGEAEARILLARLEPTRENMDKAVEFARSFYEDCLATEKNSGAALPDHTKGDFGECHVSTGAPGVTVARSMLIEANLLLGGTWLDDDAYDAAEPLIRDAIKDQRIQAEPARLLFARMQLGSVLTNRSRRSHEIEFVDQAIKIYEEDLQSQVVSVRPSLATSIRVRLATSLMIRGRYQDALTLADRSFVEIDQARDRESIVTLLFTKALAHKRLAESEDRARHSQQGLEAYRSLISLITNVDPPEMLERIRLGFLELALTNIFTSGSAGDLEEIRAQLIAAGSAIKCSSRASIRADFYIALGDYHFLLAQRNKKHLDLLISMKAYEQAVFIADRKDDPLKLKWVAARRRHAIAMGFSSWDEEHGGFALVPNAIAAFDEVIKEYQRINRSDLAAEAALAEINVFISLGNTYTDKRRRRALFDRAKFASARAQAIAKEAHLTEPLRLAQIHLAQIEKIVNAEKLNRVKPDLIGPFLSPATQVCPEQFLIMTIPD